MPQIAAQPIRSRIRRDLLDRILDGRLAPLQPIRLADAATELGVSVTPLREALIELETEGFLEARPNRGFVVAPFRARELQDLYALIGTLEVTAVRETPPTSKHLDRLEALNRKLAAASGDGWRAVKLDLEWHRTLIAASPNEILREVVARLKLRSARYAYAYLRQADRISSSVEQHGEIIARLRRGETEDGLRVLQENWRPRIMLRWLQEHEAGTPVETATL